MTTPQREQALCDIIGLARGLPPGAINAEEFDMAQLTTEIDQLGVSLVALEWAMSAAIGLLTLRRQILSDLNDIQYNKTRRPMYSLKVYEILAKTLSVVQDMEILDMSVPISSYQAACQTGRQKGVLTPSDRQTIMAYAVSQKLSVSRIKAVCRELGRLKETVGEDAITVLLGDMADVVERRNLIEEVNTDETTDDE